jgi:hypothetical protein
MTASFCRRTHRHLLDERKRGQLAAAANEAHSLPLKGPRGNRKVLEVLSKPPGNAVDILEELLAPRVDRQGHDPVSKGANGQQDGGLQRSALGANHRLAATEQMPQLEDY